MFTVSSVRHAFPENSGFVIDRKNGHPQYTFLHFYNSVDIAQRGEVQTTEPHAVILYNRGTPQFFKSHKPLIHDWFHFDGDAVESLNLPRFQTDMVYYPKNYRIITETVAELESEFFKAKPYARELSDLKIRELLIKLDRDIAEEECALPSVAYIKEFGRLRSEMFSSLNADWSVGAMARRMNLSESQFYLLYKQIYGITPTADLIRAKISRAKNRLAFTTLCVKDIAAELGYQNVTHFTRQFKSYTGKSPLSYRNSQ